MIRDLKQYFHKLGIYNGDLNSLNIDEQFNFACKSIENKLTNQIRRIDPNHYKIEGMVINSNSFDIERAFKLMAQIAPMDAMDINEPLPLATKFVPTADDMKSEPANPADSQAIGKTEQVLTKEIPVELVAKAIKRRILQNK